MSHNSVFQIHRRACDALANMRPFDDKGRYVSKIALDILKRAVECASGLKDWTYILYRAQMMKEYRIVEEAMRRIESLAPSFKQWKKIFDRADEFCETHESPDVGRYTDSPLYIPFGKKHQIDLFDWLANKMIASARTVNQCLDLLCIRDSSGKYAELINKKITKHIWDSSPDLSPSQWARIAIVDYDGIFDRQTLDLANAKALQSTNFLEKLKVLAVLDHFSVQDFIEDDIEGFEELYKWYASE